MTPFAGNILARRFFLVSFLTLVLGMLIIGTLISVQIKNGVIDQTAAITALYVDSFVSPILQDLVSHEFLSQAQTSELKALLSDSPLSQQIVSYKIWSPEGKVLFSPDASLIERSYPIDDDFEIAAAGGVSSEFTRLHKSENEYERKRWDLLIETYAPVRADNSGEIIAISEFYQLPDNLNRQIFTAQLQSWFVVGSATLVMYLILAGMYNQAGRTILKQQNDLSTKVDQLSVLLDRNWDLNRRVRRAASRTTTLSEKYLRRISSDLHDGPIQGIALALLRLEAVTEEITGVSTERTPLGDELGSIQSVLSNAISEIRTIAGGLRIPDLANLNPSQIAQRAIQDFQAKTNQSVELVVADAPPHCPTPVKITLYRVLQEALSNSFRHADAKGQSVELSAQEDHLVLRIADQGSGFDPQTKINGDHLGLAVMRERVEVLGGTFQIDSDEQKGTRIIARLPLDFQEKDD